ncbi:DUF4235 domain-containing protein [Jatrophihabitans sp.]|uniref:DUF4235 domain-containing protein n=1 Tax=Jatrophihabitans sp. TaxID=1932789 RepID=UPI0030C77307|nr:hypothetical protein [Jatrophihabitans sp.]
MANAASKVTMKVLTIAVGIPVGKATKKSIDKAWAAKGSDTSTRDPKSATARWADAIGWAALSAAGVTLAQLLTRRGAEAGYRAITGLEPPPPDPTKAEKKALKAQKKAAKAAATTAG